MLEVEQNSPTIIIGVAYTAMSIFKPTAATSQPPVKQPKFAPKIIASPATKLISPALKNEIASTLTSPLDCIKVQVPKPKVKALKRVFVIFLRKTSIPVISLKLELSTLIAYKNIQTPYIIGVTLPLKYIVAQRANKNK